MTHRQMKIKFYVCSPEDIVRCPRKVGDRIAEIKGTSQLEGNDSLKLKLKAWVQSTCWVATQHNVLEFFKTMRHIKLTFTYTVCLWLYR